MVLSEDKQTDISTIRQYMLMKMFACVPWDGGEGCWANSGGGQEQVRACASWRLLQLCLLPPRPAAAMSEYWVSHKKYFCKYCNIYIADDKPSRTQHETGLKHKGNVERFVRNLYKTGEKRKADLEEEEREMVRIQRVSSMLRCLDVVGLTAYIGRGRCVRAGCCLRSGETGQLVYPSETEGG